MEKYSQLGANTIVLPAVTIKNGAVTGAMTLVNKDLEEWSINIGIPCRKIKDRKKDIINLSKKI